MNSTLSEIRLTDAIDPDLALLQRLATSRGCSSTLRAAARVLTKHGWSDASLALLQWSDEVFDTAAEMMEGLK